MNLNEEIAGWVAAVGVGVAAVWKFIWWGRRDLRTDRVEGGVASGTYTLINNLRAENDRLLKQLEQSEKENMDLWQRLRAAERRLPSNGNGA